MTIAEFLEKTEVYEYSKEYFDIRKTCGELELLGIYCGSTEYVRENSHLSVGVLDTLIIEAAGDTANQGIRDRRNKFKSNIDKIVRWIIQIIRTVVQTLVRFYSKFIEKLCVAQEQKIDKLADAAIAYLQIHKKIDAKTVHDSGIETLVLDWEDGIGNSNPQSWKKDAGIRLIDGKLADKRKSIGSVFNKLENASPKLGKELSKIQTYLSNTMRLEIAEDGANFDAINMETQKVLGDFSRLFNNGDARKIGETNLRSQEERISELINNIARSKVRRVEKYYKLQNISDTFNKLSQDIARWNAIVERLDKLAQTVSRKPEVISAESSDGSKQMAGIVSKLQVLVTGYQSIAARLIRDFYQFGKEREAAISATGRILGSLKISQKIS
jgi:hypothetical protein